jgi:RNA polymerase sigma-70 factor (ECF subfamily)
MGNDMQAGTAQQPIPPGMPLPRLPDLATLVRSMAEGHQEALARLYDETASMVNGLLLRILAHPQDAEEVLLDVFMKAWKYAASYSEKRGSVQAWLLIMARNSAIDRIRAKKAQPATLSFEPEAFPEPVSADATPEEASVIEERRRRVQRVLNKLPREQREVVVLSFFGGLTHAELAERLGEPLGTVKSRVRMGLHKLRGLLQEPVQ